MIRHLELTLLFLALAGQDVLAQSLPKPSRTIFKCEANGKVTYSDEPCLGAKRIDAEPTRGADSYSGTRRIGEDVRQEIWRENLAGAIRPFTGTSAQQFDALVRRQGLSAAAQLECQELEHRIIRLERGDAAELELQRELLARRNRFAELRC